MNPNYIKKQIKEKEAEAKDIEKQILSGFPTLGVLEIKNLDERLKLITREINFLKRKEINNE